MDASDTCHQRRGHKIFLKILCDILLWLAVGIPLLYLYLEGNPYERGFFCDDLELSYPYKPETVSNTVLMVGCFSISITVIMLTETLNYIDTQCRRQCLTGNYLVKCLQIYAVFLVGFVTQQFLVEAGKKYIGRLRPNFFDVCKPSFNRSQCPGYISSYMCTATNQTDLILDSRQSFPSGHSSIAMYVAVFFCFYIQNHLRIGFSHILKFLMQYCLIFSALWCGISRLVDHKHHATDILAGFLVGGIVASLVFQSLKSSVVKEDTCSNKDSIFIKTIAQSFNCCDCKEQQTCVEPQTPSPLLTHEYSNGVLDVTSQNYAIIRETSEKKNKLAIPLNVRRHFSTPITPSHRPEET